MTVLVRSESLHRFLREPLNLAGLLTWLLIAGDQLPPAIQGDPARAVALGVLLLAYLLAFAAANLAELRGDAARGRHLSLALLPLALLDGVLTAGITAPILLVIALSMLATRLPLGATLALAALANGLYYLIFRELWQIAKPLYTLTLYGSFQAFSVLLARMAFAAENARAELARVNAHLQATRHLLGDAARAGERLRLSRELHDLAGHRLTALRLNLELARRLPEAEGRDDRLAQALRLSDALLDDIRAVVGQLRAHDGLALAPSLQLLAQGLPGLQLELDLPDDLRVPDVDTAEVLQRCVQEGLTNALRHGGARRVRLQLVRQDGGLALRLSDDGRGHLQPKPGHGLTGMRERVEALGGRLLIEGGGAGRGFALDVWLPERP